MRFLLLAFLAFPALAQSPDKREIAFKCHEGYCVLSESDWKWVMESMKAKDTALERLMTKCGWKST